MAKNVKVKVDIDISGLMQKTQSDALGLYAAQQWHRLYYDYVPYDTGALADNVTISPWKIEHTVPYAEAVFNGKHMRFQRDRHPKASARWDRAATPSQLPKLTKSIQQYIEKIL